MASRATGLFSKAFSMPPRSLTSSNASRVRSPFTTTGMTSSAVSNVVKRSPHERHSRRRRICRPSPARRESLTFVSTWPQNGQCMRRASYGPYEPYTGNRRHSSSTCGRTRSISDGAPSASRICATKSATCSICASLKPRVVEAGVPRRRPLVIVGGRGSFGTAFLFTVMLALPSAASASLPVMLRSARLSRNR